MSSQAATWIKETTAAAVRLIAANMQLSALIAFSVIGMIAAVTLSEVWGSVAQMLPIYILVGTIVLLGIGTVALTVFQKGSEYIDGPASQRLLLVLVVTAGIVLALSIIICALCQQPRPREMFVDGSGDGNDPLAPLRTGIAAAEVAVCKYITQADKYIKGDVGPKADKEPDLVTAAQQKARDGVNMVLCSDGAPAEVDSSGDLTELDSRLSRLESTLSGFTGVVFKRAYEETVPCKEGFAVPTVEDLTQRLKAVQAAISDQQTQYLDPMDQKTKDLQQGKASDCDKRRGAKMAVGPKARGQ
jgi:hypothetical protein